MKYIPEIIMADVKEMINTGITRTRYELVKWRRLTVDIRNNEIEFYVTMKGHDSYAMYLRVNEATDEKLLETICRMATHVNLTKYEKIA